MPAQFWCGSLLKTFILEERKGNGKTALLLLKKVICKDGPEANVVTEYFLPILNVRIMLADK
jgi:hypothetical protein